MVVDGRKTDPERTVGTRQPSGRQAAIKYGSSGQQAAIKRQTDCIQAVIKYGQQPLRSLRRGEDQEALGGRRGVLLVQEDI